VYETLPSYLRFLAQLDLSVQEGEIPVHRLLPPGETAVDTEGCARSSVDGRGAILRSGRSRVRVFMTSLEFLNLTLPAALGPEVYSISNRT
jgi:hypothetical protein